MSTVGKTIEGLAVPIIAVDANLQIHACNSLAQQAFTGLSAAGGFDSFIARIDGLKGVLLSTLKTGAPTIAKIKPKAGYRSDYSVTIKNIGHINEAGSTVLLMTFEDRSLFNDIKAMRIGFVANVSHEIRSPLTAISGFVETLQGPAINDVAVRERFLGLMAKEVTRMTNLVSDLLSLSQVEAKERHNLKKQVAMQPVIEQAVESIRPVANKLDKTLNVEIDGELPAITGRQDDLLRVLINLLENAVHYSRPDGQIHLLARVDTGANPLEEPAIAISITDDGEGIAAAEIPFLTQRFYRVDKSRSRNMGGTGLGLAIVKHILVRHRGELDIQSTLGQGAVFTIYLPLAWDEKNDLS